ASFTASKRRRAISSAAAAPSRSPGGPSRPRRDPRRSSMRLAIVIVHYHTPALAAEAVAALAADLAGAGIADDIADLVLVDNGSDAAGREILERLPVRRLDPGENLGYAGG